MESVMFWLEDDEMKCFHLMSRKRIDSLDLTEADKSSRETWPIAEFRAGNEGLVSWTLAASHS